MSRVVVFKRVSAINCDMGVKPSPVRALEPHVAFSTGVLGFKLAGRDEQSAALRRDGVQIELVVTPGHAPGVMAGFPSSFRRFRRPSVERAVAARRTAACGAALEPLADLGGRGTLW
jgi:hypothetical protein